MKKWTIGKRIVTGNAALVLLLLIVGTISLAALRNIERLAIDRLRNDSIPGTISIADITVGILRSHIVATGASAAANAEELEKIQSEMTKLTENVIRTEEAYAKTISLGEDAKNFDILKQKRSAYLAERATYLDFIKAGKRTEADGLAKGALSQAYEAYRDITVVMLKWNGAAADTDTNQLIEKAHSAFLQSTVVSVGGLLLAVILAWVIIRSVNSTLQTISVTLDDAANQVASAARQVSSSSQSLADGSSQQAASLEETSASIEELSSMTKRNADSAATAKDLSAQTRQAADAGSTDMAEMRAAMDAIKSSSADIAKIIKTIDEIAFQTNILALNAAVEAARAGEAGMGFAVVADEVRNLAQRSAHSAKETASKIEVAIQNGENGVVISQKVAKSLGVILERARQVDELVAEIATASQQQSQGLGQINSAVSQMDQVTQNNAGNAEETASAAAELNSQSASLRESVQNLRRLVESDQKRPTAAAAAEASQPDPTSALRRPAKPSAEKSSAAKPALVRPKAKAAASDVADISMGEDHFKNF